MTESVVATAAKTAGNLRGQAVSAAKGPLHMVRGTSPEEKLLKNAKTEYWNEHEEIATYMAIETLAEAVGDKETAKLARDIRRDEEKMARYLERLIPALTKAVVKTEIPAAERRKPAARKRSGSSSTTSDKSQARQQLEEQELRQHGSQALGQHEEAQHRQEELILADRRGGPSYLEGMTTAAPDKALEEARWNLDPLVDGKGAEGTLELLAEARERAVAFAEKHRGKVSELDAAGLAAAMRELEDMFDKVGRAGSYASLWFTVDTADPERGALLQQVQERGAEIETSLIFFELEWNEVPDEQAETLLAADELEFCRHHLKTSRRYRPHQLSEPEELILTETEVTGRSAFGRLFTEQISSVMVDLPDSEDPVPLMEALSRLQDPDRERRAEAADAVTKALEPGLRTRAFIFNTLLQDKSTKDRLRSYPHWLAARNLSNEASDESVEALIEAVVSHYELARRWYRLKAKLLGLGQARSLRPDGAGCDGGAADRLRRRAGAGSRLLPQLLA